jgi:hypothetical protein
MKRTVFISHSSQDKKIADAVCNFLEKHGVLCWIAPRDVTPGKNYGAAIIDAISECDFFVLILSSLSNDSQQVVREVERAASTQAVVIPLRVEAVQPSKDLQFYVSSSHWLDAVTPPLDQHLMELLRAIEGWQKDEGRRRRRSPQPVEDVATVASLDTPVPAGVPVKKRSSVWLYVVAATTILVVCASVLLLKRSSSTTPTKREGSVARATPSVAAETSPAQIAAFIPTRPSTSVVAASPAQVAALIPTTPSTSAVAAEASPPQIVASTPPAGDPLKVLTTFPQEFLEKLGGHDIDAVLRYFEEPANYYDSGKVSRSFIRKDLERDERTWPKRSYSLHGDPKITPAEANSFTIEFPMTYSLTNERGTANGLLKMTMRCELNKALL